MSPERQHDPKHEDQPSPSSRPVIHRVCITCNNMFRVAPENYEAKQCPTCHKEG